MKYIWFLPPSLAVPVATLLIMAGGFALVVGRRALGGSMILSAVLLVVMPAFDPVVEQAVDVAIDTGTHLVRSWSWWAVTAVFVITALLAFHAVVKFIFNKQVADHATGTLIADGVRGILRMLVVWPFRLLGYLPWQLRLAVVVIIAAGLAWVWWRVAGPGSGFGGAG